VLAVLTDDTTAPRSRTGRATSAGSGANHASVTTTANANNSASFRCKGFIRCNEDFDQHGKRKFTRVKTGICGSFFRCVCTMR
jgi:hypothetical protein